MTSRLSYTSAAESDGEFCGEELSPRRSGTLKQDPSGRLVRVASDPSLARPDPSGRLQPAPAPPPGQGHHGRGLAAKLSPRLGGSHFILL